MGAAMQTDEHAAMTMPKAIGTAKLATAVPLQMASGGRAAMAVRLKSRPVSANTPRPRPAM